MKPRFLETRAARVIAIVLAVILCGGAIAALIPRGHRECRHTHAIQIYAADLSAVRREYRYNCLDCGADFTRDVAVSRFADNRPPAYGTMPDGNWSAGWVDPANGTYTRYNGHSAEDSSWLCDAVDGLWSPSGHGGIWTTMETSIGVTAKSDTALVYTAPASGTLMLSCTRYAWLDLYDNAAGTGRQMLCRVTVNGAPVRFPGTDADGFVAVTEGATSMDDINALLSSLTVRVKAGDEVRFVCRRDNTPTGLVFWPAVTYTDDLPETVYGGTDHA